MQQSLGSLKRAIEFILSWFSALLLTLMTVMVLIQVFSRYLFNAPTAFTEELVRYLLIWTGFIGAAYAFSMRKHMALTVVRDKLSAGQKRLLNTAVDILVLVFALLVMVIGGTSLMQSVSMEYSPLLEISRSVVYCMAPISGVFIILAQLINVYEDVTGIALGQEAK